HEMDGLQARFKYYVSQADKELSNYPKIVKLEQQTGIQKTYLAASVVAKVVYAKGIRPFLLEYEYDVDKNISKLNKKVVDDVLDSSS
ncbi:19226_t:CDS:2, partial [Entrophospora sp. SA101]